VEGRGKRGEVGVADLATGDVRMLDLIADLMDDTDALLKILLQVEAIEEEEEEEDVKWIRRRLRTRKLTAQGFRVLAEPRVQVHGLLKLGFVGLGSPLSYFSFFSSLPFFFFFLLLFIYLFF
jgi:hypothetical protein